jgi:hypothetical protein
MERLLANPSLRQDLGLRGYQTYLQEWTADVHMDRYFELIRKIQHGD